MRKPNHLWNEMMRACVYPSGHISVTEQEMYASVESMHEWSAVFFIAALAWMASDARYWT